MLHSTAVNLNNDYFRFLNNTGKTFLLWNKNRQNIILIRINELNEASIFGIKHPPPPSKNHFMDLHKSILVQTKNTITIQYLRTVVNYFTCFSTLVWLYAYLEHPLIWNSKKETKYKKKTYMDFFTHRFIILKLYIPWKCPLSFQACIPPLCCLFIYTLYCILIVIFDCSYASGKIVPGHHVRKMAAGVIHARSSTTVQSLQILSDFRISWF